MLAVPSGARLLISLALSIGISLILLRLLYPRLLTMSKQGQDAFDANPGLARPNDVIGRFAPFTIVAFVFLTGITISQFWANARLTTEAVSTELANYSRAVSYASSVPDDQGGSQITAGLDAYRRSVVDDQWPLLQHAQAQDAYEAQSSAAGALRETMAAASASGANQDVVWDDLSTAVDDMLFAGTDRIDSVPQSNAMALILLVIALGIVNLAALSLVSVSYPSLSMLLMGIAGALVGLLMFVAVEMSNPFLISMPWLG